MLRRLTALLKISRPFASVSVALATLVGGLFAGGAIGFALVAASLAMGLLAAAGNMLNDVIDLPVDRLNQPQRMLPQGRLTPTQALVAAAVLGSIALALALLVNPLMFVVAALVALLLVAYSKGLKNTILLGNFVIAILVGQTFLYGALAVNNVSAAVPLALVAVTGILAREVLKTIADQEGDRAGGLHTIATAWGVARALRVYRMLVALFLVASLVPLVTAQLGLRYLFVWCIGILPIPLFAYVKTIGSPSAASLRMILAASRLGFLTWMLAVVIDRL